MSDRNEDSVGGAAHTGANNEAGSNPFSYADDLGELVKKTDKDLVEELASASPPINNSLPSASDNNDAEALRKSIFGVQATDANR